MTKENIIRITGVPEHFNLPWRKIVNQQPFLERQVRLEWIDESRGSGQMNQALRKGETDIAIVLTESFLKDHQQGNSSKLIGFHVKSPLIWGIHVGSQSKYKSLQDIQNPRFYISRLGSGSNLMAYVLAKRENWNSNELQFEIVDNLDGALSRYESDPDAIFLWEKYTTMPWVQSGQLRRIGEVPSPWPCFGISCRQEVIDQFGDLIFDLRDQVYQLSNSLQKAPDLAEEISSLYHLDKEQVSEWLLQTEWETESIIDTNTLNLAMEKMVELGILSEKINPKAFLAIDRIRLAN